MAVKKPTSAGTSMISSAESTHRRCLGDQIHHHWSERTCEGCSCIYARCVFWRLVLELKHEQVVHSQNTKHTQTSVLSEISTSLHAHHLAHFFKNLFSWCFPRFFTGASRPSLRLRRQLACVVAHSAASRHRCQACSWLPSFVSCCLQRSFERWWRGSRRKSERSKTKGHWKRRKGTRIKSQGSKRVNDERWWMMYVWSCTA